MDPISMLIAGASLAMQFAGGMGAAHAQAGIANSQMAVAGDEQKADDQRRQAMELDAQRKQMEVFRNQQRARALALNSATNQGAQQGSGLQGGYGQISGESNTNLLGITQNLEIGRNLFSINADINKQKMIQAQFGSQLASSQGLSSFGKALGAATPVLSSFSQGFGGGGPAAAGKGGF